MSYYEGDSWTYHEPVWTTCASCKSEFDDQEGEGNICPACVSKSTEEGENMLEEGKCDSCNGAYDLGDRFNRCGNCGNCENCCKHIKKEGESKCVCTDEPPYQECFDHSGY